jgi:uncharacterized membrane protein YhiD involved in acid resistance
LWKSSLDGERKRGKRKTEQRSKEREEKENRVRWEENKKRKKIEGIRRRLRIKNQENKRGSLSLVIRSKRQKLFHQFVSHLLYSKRVRSAGMSLDFLYLWHI